jgi:hypothetical protein
LRQVFAGLDFVHICQLIYARIEIFSDKMAAVSLEESSAHVHMGQFKPGDYRTEGLVHKSRDETLSKH